MKKYFDHVKKIIGARVLDISVTFRNRIDRLRLTNRNFTIFACNCAAGCMYHDLGLPFDSPTINLYIYPEDYLRFLKNPQYYFREKITFLSENEKTESFPVGVIGGGARNKDLF